MEASTQFAGTLLFLFLFYSTRGLDSATFTIVNKCSYPVWPGILSSAGTAQLTTTGFVLELDETNVIAVPTAWSGRIWGRTLCSTDSTGIFSCATGDCGSSKVECTGSGAVPPATLAEFTLNGAGGMDFYDVSLVDGYNLPMTVEPRGGGGNCTTTGCTVDLNEACPTELKLKVKITVEGEESVEKTWHAKARVRLLGIRCIVAVALMQHRRHVNQVRTRSISRTLAHALIAMLMMMELAHLLVLPRIMSLLSVLHLPKGNLI